MARSDEWAREHTGVLRSRGARRTWDQAQMGGCLATDGIASHQAGANLQRLPHVPPRLVVTIQQRRQVDLKGFDVHRTTRLEAVDVTHVRGIPVTSVARTAIDVCLAMPAIAALVIDHLLGTRKLPLALLINRLDAMGLRGRRGAADLMRLLQERKGVSRHVDSRLQRQLEQIALEGYRAGILPEPHFEYPVQLADGRWRYPDVAYPRPIAVGFEALSYRHHSTLPDWAGDVERLLDLFGEGWVIVPVTKMQVQAPKRLTSQMARIIAAVEARRQG